MIPTCQSTTTYSTHGAVPRNRVIHGDCIEVMRALPPDSIDLVIADPPYLVRYRPRDARTYSNDDNDRWLEPAYAEAYRVLKPNRVCISFYGWSRAERFLCAWRLAGFRPIAHLVFVKRYASATKFVRYQHEQAYVLAKGRPANPREPIADVIAWEYTGNPLHPTQKPVSVLEPLVRTCSQTGDLVLDPFCGSGSSLIAARNLGRAFLGIELIARYHQAAVERLGREQGV
jgi:site-specific DNA-methyltransferase (adenine-specific)